MRKKITKCFNKKIIYSVHKTIKKIRNWRFSIQKQEILFGNLLYIIQGKYA